MSEHEDRIAEWVDAEGYSYPLEILTKASCIAIGEEEVGLRIAYLKNAIDQNEYCIRVKLSPEHALQLAGMLRAYADRPRPPVPKHDK